MTKKENDQRQESLMQLQMLDSQIKQTEQQLMQMEQQTMELTETIDNLVEFKNVKVGSEIFVPIANGIFAKAEIKDVMDLNVNIGAGIVTKKSIDETKEMLDKHLLEMNSYKDEVFSQLQNMVQYAKELQKQLGKK